MSKTGTELGSGRPASASATSLPPEDDTYTVPLNLMSEMARIGLGSGDLVIVESLPEGAALTIGENKPDGSWILLPHQLAEAEYIPLSHNGRTYQLVFCVLTPDPADHGLPKTKAKLKISVRVPLAKLPSMESLLASSGSDEVAPGPSGTADPQPVDAGAIALPPPDAETDAEAVICLPADPRLKSADQPPAPLALPTPRVAASEPAVAIARRGTEPADPPPSAIDLDKHFAIHAAEWKAHLSAALQTAEHRLKSSQLEQLARIQAALSREEAARVTAIEANWKAELERRASAAEERLRTDDAGRLDVLRLQAGGPDSAAAALLAAARQEWEAQAAAERIALETRLKAQYEERLAALEAAPVEKDARAPNLEALEAEIEGRITALYDMRLAMAEASWRNAEAQRLGIAEATWFKGEAERMSAAEARWRAEHDKRLEAVLANFGLLMRGQLGQIEGHLPLPVITPATLPHAVPAAEPRPSATEAPNADRADAVTHGVETAWRAVAAA